MPSVYIKTYGCQMNERDSEAVAAQLVAKGYTLAPGEATADVILLNTCSVRDLAEQNLSKAHYLASQLKPRFSGPFFNEFVVRAPEERNKALLKKKIIGGLPLGRFYPELADSMLLCATEMSRRADMDAVAEALA